MTADREQIIGDIKQRAQLEQLIGRARRLVEALGPLLDAHRGNVHFRPSTTGVDMVGLSPERPLQGRAAIRNLSRFAVQFDDEFRRWCLDAPPLKASAEKRLQAFLIREAYRADRRLDSLNRAAERRGQADELLFVTDDIAIPFKGKRFACDVLAVTAGMPRRAAVLELSRGLDFGAAAVRVDAYASLVDRHADLYGELYSALLEQRIELTPPAERWLLWPRDAALPSARERAVRDIHLAFWAAGGEGFALDLASLDQREQSSDD